jgi:hypothetical protein
VQLHLWHSQHMPLLSLLLLLVVVVAAAAVVWV